MEESGLGGNWIDLNQVMRQLKLKLKRGVVASSHQPQLRCSQPILSQGLGRGIHSRAVVRPAGVPRRQARNGGEVHSRVSDEFVPIVSRHLVCVFYGGCLLSYAWASNE